jgi:hypothetical protein
MNILLMNGTNIQNWNHWQDGQGAVVNADGYVINM